MRACLALALTLLTASSAAQSRSGSGSSGPIVGGFAGGYAGIGRAATPAEIKAWDIDVRPDFKGLPPGRGTVARGQEVWEAKCTSCHGMFGESNQMFPPLVGGTSRQDMQSGRVASLANDSEAQRTMMMKMSSVSTLWDYINRAMPWNAPKTLSVEEVYAVTAFILHLADVVPDNFALTHQNIAGVQAKLPNRHGKTHDHGMWLAKGKPDIKATACMRNCADGVKVASFIPGYARDAHGNLAEQSRVMGATRGQVTLARVAVVGAAGAAPVPVDAQGASEFAGVKAVAARGACMSCHAIDRKLVGPGFHEVQQRYQADPQAQNQLAGKIKAGGQGVWGVVPMPASPALSDADAVLLAKWILRGAPE